MKTLRFGLQKLSESGRVKIGLKSKFGLIPVSEKAAPERTEPKCPYFLEKTDISFSSPELSGWIPAYMTFSASDCNWSIASVTNSAGHTSEFGFNEGRWIAHVFSEGWSYDNSINFNMHPETGEIVLDYYWGNVGPIDLTIEVHWLGTKGDDICEITQTFELRFGMNA